MKSSDITLNKSNPINHLEESNEKSEKNLDKNLELIFEDYFEKKMAREARSELASFKTLEEASNRRFQVLNLSEFDRNMGLQRREEEVYKDKTDSDTSFATVGGASVAGTMASPLAQPESNNDETVQKLEKLVNEMIAQELVQASMVVRVTGQSEAAIDLALTRSNGQIEVLLSSKSSTVLNLMFNQVNELEGYMQTAGHSNIRLTIVQ